MDEYIKREAAIKALFKLRSTYRKTQEKCAVGGCIVEIQEVPAADVVEVRHGEWAKYEIDETYGSNDSKTWYKCSECQKGAHGWVDGDTWYSFPILSDYCPNCGAKMDGRGEGE